MDLRADLRRELEPVLTRDRFLECLLRFGTGRTRCPNGAAFLLDGKDYRRVAATGKARDLPDSIPALLPTGRNARNVLLPGDEPARPPAFLRLEWDGPRIHDPEAVEALEEACVEAAELLAKLVH